MASSTQSLFTSSLPELYERFLVEPVFRPFAEELLRRADVARRLLGEAGFGSIQVERVTRTIRMNDASVFPRLNAMAIVGMSAAGKAIADQQRADVMRAIADDSLEVARPCLEGNTLVFDFVSIMATARA